MLDTGTVTAPAPGAAPSVREGWNVRVILGSAAMAFCLGTIAYLVGYGNPSNSLHQSALSWSYGLVGGILLAFGIGSLDALTSLLSRKP